ncbi:MAG: tetratricopeptide repeat protein [Elusimicrobia bacterium]|nr:tetratricopeptide repeat protein [Elusimicrobiota bacterium]
MSIEKHWATKQSSKQDEVRDFVGKGLDLAVKHRKEVGKGLGAAAVVGLLIGFFVYSRSANENEAWDKLSMAEAYSYYGRPKEAADALAELTAQSASPAAASLAGLMQGELKQAKGEHDAALASFTHAVEVAPEPLKPFAAAEKVSALEAAGKPAECITAAQAFLDANADHFLAPQVQEVMARCQLASGQADAARATWQKISLQYPDTPWAVRANARLNPPTK